MYGVSIALVLIYIYMYIYMYIYKCDIETENIAIRFINGPTAILELFSINRLG